jgi:hypothetical protein
MRKPGYKEGANYTDQNRIKALAEGGSSAEEISDILRIHQPVVENFMPDKPKRKRRTKEEIAADEASEQTEE